MRTTVGIPDPLYRRLKSRACRSVKELILRGVQGELEPRRKRGHVHHECARRWFESFQVQDDSSLCFCRITQLSFLRLITSQCGDGNRSFVARRGVGRI
jgi:hypothetical protein